MKYQQKPDYSQKRACTKTQNAPETGKVLSMSIIYGHVSPRETQYEKIPMMNCPTVNPYITSAAESNIYDTTKLQIYSFCHYLTNFNTDKMARCKYLSC